MPIKKLDQQVLNKIEEIEKEFQDLSGLLKSAEERRESLQERIDMPREGDFFLYDLQRFKSTNRKGIKILQDLLENNRNLLSKTKKKLITSCDSLF